MDLGKLTSSKDSGSTVFVLFVTKLYLVKISKKVLSLISNLPFPSMTYHLLAIANNIVLSKNKFVGKAPLKYTSRGHTQWDRNLDWLFLSL